MLIKCYMLFHRCDLIPIKYREAYCHTKTALQFGRRREYGRSGHSTDAGGGSTEGVRSQYRLTLSAASAAYVKHEITFKIGLRIAAEIHRHITDTAVSYTHLTLPTNREV